MRNITEHLTAPKVLFENRRDAGQKLAGALSEYANLKVVVLAIPNGGVPIATEIASSLHAELDIMVCRKLVLPMNPKGGLGAVADDGTCLIDEEVIKREGLNREQVEYEASQVKANVRQRSLRYRGEALPPRLTGKVAIIVDDGFASGITMTVAIEAVKHRRPREIVVAVPVASTSGYDKVCKSSNNIVTCAIASMPKFFLADFYRNWRDINDNETLLLLDQWRRRQF